MRKKLKNQIYRLFSLFLLTAILCTILTGCGGAKQPLTLDEQLDLGMRYLNELDYENAIIAFSAAIEIDPRNAQANAGLYAAYIAHGEPEKADETWAAMLEAGVSEDEVLLWIETIADQITEGGGDGEAVKQAALKKAHAEDKDSRTEKADSVPAYTALQNGKIEISIIPTDITADSVINFDGYGSLAVNGEGHITFAQNESGDWIPTGYTVTPQAALIDSCGEFVFPYLETESRYYYSDGVVSLSDPYNNNYAPLLENEPRAAHAYFSIDGTPILYMDEMEDIDFVELRPFGDGVAFVRFCCFYNSYEEYGPPEEYTGGAYISGVGTGGMVCKAGYLIDKQGNILVTFPEGFNEIWGNEFSSHGHVTGVGWSSEGLIPVGSLYRFGGHISDITDTRNETMAYGFMDHSGNMVIPQMFSGAGNFSEGLAAVRSSDGQWGYIDKAGNSVIPFEYDGADSFMDGLANVYRNGKVGYINAQNEIVIPFDYDNGFTAGGGVCPVAKNGKYGLIDYNGNEVLPCGYDDISECKEGVVYAIKDRQVYIITVKQQ